MKPNSVARNPIPQDRDPISIWKVCLPFDYDRQDYIKTCYLTGTVIVSNENGEQNKAKIGKLALQLISFPLTSDTFGSEVCCLSAPYGGQMYVADVYSKSTEFIYQGENQYRFEKHTDHGQSEVYIDGNGNLVLSVDSENDDGGTITITATNKNRNGKLNIVVNGDIVVHNDGNILIKTSQQALIDSPKILLNDGDEPVLLGNKVVDFISEWLDILSKDSAGPYSLRSATQYANLKNKLDELKSTLTFLK